MTQHTSTRSSRRLVPLLAVLLWIGTVVARAGDPVRFVFAVTADPRANGDSWRNALLQIRDVRANPDPAFAAAEFLLAVGDQDPLSARYRDFQDVFQNAPRMKAFLPLMGNHDVHDRAFLRTGVLEPQKLGIRLRDAQSMSYSWDWANTRVIMVDAYAGTGADGVVNRAGRDWVEAQIKNAPPTVENVFVATHVPVFPRHRHTGEAFDQAPEERDAFWNLLIRHRDRVRAVFVGHTHYFSRMRVADPTGPAATELQKFPDEAGGIWQVDAGAAGNGDRNTVVLVEVNGTAIRFRALQAANGKDQPFALVDEWSLPGKR